MTRAAQLGILCSMAGIATHEKQALATAARLGSGMIRYGGKAVGGALKGISSFGRSGQMANMGRMAPTMMQRAGSAVQAGSRTMANRMQGWGAVRGANAARAARLNPPMPGNYSPGLRGINNAMDRWAQPGGMIRNGLRGVSRMVVPQTWFGGAKTLGLVGMGMDRYNHGQRLQDAGNYGAARAIHELRQNPFTNGLGAIFGSSNQVADSLATRGYRGAGDYLREFAQTGNTQGPLNDISLGAMIPGYSKLVAR